MGDGHTWSEEQAPCLHFWGVPFPDKGDPGRRPNLGQMIMSLVQDVLKPRLKEQAEKSKGGRKVY